MNNIDMRNGWVCFIVFIGKEILRLFALPSPSSLFRVKIVFNARASKGHLTTRQHRETRCFLFPHPINISG
jgi:hypothetical protein